VRQAGLDAFRAGLVASVPMFADRAAELADWDQIKLLTVAVDRLATWHRPGLLCLGDAAHAMSPIGGVGVNLAVQDAVAAANLLWEPLSRGAPSDDDLARVQHRREFPARLTQRIQVVVQNNVVSRALQASGGMKVPFAIRLLARFPLLRRIPARLLGLGIRPEHVKAPENPVRQTAG
jgi:2-polyprenyl-6-methoxyphenol hydroxylase-like FAD-dependent oxidoreductase